MTTNFPTSVDAFTNPTSNDTLDNPPHDQQHADINDAMEAVQTSLLDGSPLKIDDANNRVGIGTASPSTTLDVAGAVSADGFVYVGAFDALEGGELQLDKGTSGSHHFRLDNYNDNGRFLSSTAVMANINLSTHRLDVYGDINSTGKFYQNGGVYGGIVAIGHDGQYSAVATTGSTVVSTGLSVTMTPKSSSSKFLIFNSIPCYCGTDSNGYSSVAFSLRRNGSNILAENGFMYDGNSGTQHVGKWCHTFLDSPNTTSAVTYELFFSNHPYSNGQAQISVSTGAGYTPSQMWIWELAQ